MPIELWQGLLIPFAGTTLGAACVFFMRNNLGEMVQRALTGFAAGVMVAASIWSLLLPAMEQAADMGRWSFVPAVVGFWLGIFFLLGLDRLIPHLHRGSAEAEGIKSSLGKTTMLTLFVLHIRTSILNFAFGCSTQQCHTCLGKAITIPNEKHACKLATATKTLTSASLGTPGSAPTDSPRSTPPASDPSGSDNRHPSSGGAEPAPRR